MGHFELISRVPGVANMNAPGRAAAPIPDADASSNLRAIARGLLPCSKNPVFARHS